WQRRVSKRWSCYETRWQTIVKGLIERLDSFPATRPAFCVAEETMQPRNNTDQFDAFRSERKRVRAKLGPQTSVLGYENNALRELEKVEAREVRDQQLTREVHDFFAAATRQAAAIVEKV